MSTLDGLFGLARAALSTNQAALSATADNIANQNTAGYTRQVVNFRSGDTVTLSNGNTTTDTGPSVITSSVRDRILEQRVQQQTQVQAQTSARADVLSQIENVFSLSGSAGTAGSTAIGVAINSLFSSLTALAGNPTDAATRQGVLSAAGSLASQFQAASTQLTQVAQSLGSSISSSVTAVNGLTATIARLNSQIQSNSPHADAGLLEDQRQQAISQLSQYVGLDQATTESNGVTLTTAGGAPLVSGTRAFALTAVSSGGVTSIRDSSWNDVTAGLQGGSIGGQLAAQHTDVPAVAAALDSLAFRIATAVNTQNAAGVTPAGAAGGLIFGVPATASGAAGALTVAATATNAIAAAGVGEGVGGSTNANALAGLAAKVDGSGLTIAGSLAATLASVGTSSSALGQQSTAEQTTLTQLTTQRDSLSAVSLDTEAANLTQYQRSYEAAAKLFSVLDTLLASAINLGSPTTVA